MKKANYNFCVVWLTKDYYPMLDGCVYKHSRSNFKDVMVINVDMGSTDENLETGKEICEKLLVNQITEQYDFEIIKI